MIIIEMFEMAVVLIGIFYCISKGRKRTTEAFCEVMPLVKDEVGDVTVILLHRRNVKH